MFSQLFVQLFVFVPVVAFVSQSSPLEDFHSSNGFTLDSARAQPDEKLAQKPDEKPDELAQQPAAQPDHSFSSSFFFEFSHFDNFAHTNAYSQSIDAYSQSSAAYSQSIATFSQSIAADSQRKAQNRRKSQMSQITNQL